MRFLILFLITALGLQGQDSVMTPKLLWELGRVSLDDVSDDGRYFLYGVTRYDIDSNRGNRDLYLYDLKREESSQLTETPGSEYGAQFIKNNIGFNYQGQYYLLNRNTKNRQALTQIEGGISGGKAFVTPQGLFLLFSKEVKVFDSASDAYPDLDQANFKIIDDLMYRHWDHWNDEMVSHLCITQLDLEQPVDTYQDLMEGEPYECPIPPFGGSDDYTMSPDGKQVAYTSKKLNGKDFAEQTNSDIYLVDLETMQSHNLSNDNPGYDRSPKFSPDGKHLAWLSMKTAGYESDVNDLVIYDPEQQFQLRVLEDQNLYDQLTFQSFRWSENDELYAGVPIGGSNHIYEIELEKDFEEVEEIEKVTSGDHNHNHFEVVGEALLVERQDMNHATEIYRISEKGESEKITGVNDEIYQTINTGKVEKRMLATTDDKEMLTWVIYPPNFDPEKKYPTLLYCQGGPQAQVSQFYSFRWNFQLMAAQGYIVVAPNRRGLPGFGREWNEQISGDWGGQAMRDYLAAIDQVSVEPYVDRDNLGCIGASYGGYSVYQLAGMHDGRFGAFISHCGLFDLESWYLSTEEMFFANYDLGGPYWEDGNEETYEKFDPKDQVENWDTPILVIHGGKDFRVPENQGMQAFNAAQLRGIPSRFLYFPEEGHWILSPQNGLVWHDQFFKWLDQWLKN